MTSKTVQVNSGPLEISHSAKINTAAFGSQLNTYTRVWQWMFCKQASLPTKHYVGCLPAKVWLPKIHTCINILWRKIFNNLATFDVREAK